MAKNDPKKAKAKGGKPSKKKPGKKSEDDAVVAELELRDKDLDAVSGGTTLPTRNLGASPNLSTATKNLTTENLAGPEPHLVKDALNLGLY
jgi:hypothetical protein